MKKMTADDLRRTALAMGAEAVIGGRPFNTSRTVVAPSARPVPQTSTAQNLTPAPPAETFSRAQVEQMLAEQEQRLTQTMTSLLANLVRPAEPDADDEMHAAALVPQYGPDKEILRIDIDWKRLQ